MTQPVHVEIAKGGRGIDIYYAFDQERLAVVKRLRGRRFVQTEKCWRVPLDMDSCHALRAAFGDSLVIGEQLTTWAFRQRDHETKLRGLANATDGTLVNLPQTHPQLLTYLRPYQRGGAVYVAAADGFLLADDPGLGKTVQLIAGVCEAGLEQGLHLVVAPKTSLQTVWGMELGQHQHQPVYVAPEGHSQRAQLLAAFRECCVDTGWGGWLVVNPRMIGLVSKFNCGACMMHDGTEPYKVLRGCDYCDEIKVSPWPDLHTVTWTTITVDECQKDGTRNPKAMSAQGLRSLRLAAGGKRVALSGTPMKGRVEDLFGTLQWLDPARFTSKWDWVDRWCLTSSNGYGRVVDGLNPELEQAFYQTHAPYILRRTKQQVAPELPPKQYVDLWLTMTPGQAKQYAAMALDAEIRIEEQDLSATSVLAEYTRLKQFADARCTLAQRVDSKGRSRLLLRPTADSCKLEALLELLEERGILDAAGDAQVVVFSQFSEMLDMVETELTKLGVRVGKITGAVSQKRRDRLMAEFQDGGGLRVMLLTTTAGGVSITLDRADTAVMLDEMWAPDDQQQAEDRIHRISRIHNVTIYYLRTRAAIDEQAFDKTIEELIKARVADKAAVNRRVLDELREEAMTT